MKEMVYPFLFFDFADDVMIQLLFLLAMLWFIAWWITPIRNTIKTALKKHPKVYKLIAPPWIWYLLLWVVLLYARWWWRAVLIVWWLCWRFYFDPLLGTRIKDTATLLYNQVNKQWLSDDKQKTKRV